MLEMEAGVTPVSPTSQVKALDLTPEQWEAIESFQQRSGAVRFDLETSHWLERGKMIGEKKLHPAAVSSERWHSLRNRGHGKRWMGSKSTEQQNP